MMCCGKFCRMLEFVGHGVLREAQCVECQGQISLFWRHLNANISKVMQLLLLHFSIALFRIYTDR